jgi:Protein of unknown function (DUF1552)
MRYLSRRTWLRAAGGVALGLPLLDVMQPRSASAQQAGPRRIIFEFKPNGDQVQRRFTNTGERDFAFDEFLEPLEPYRDELLILNRLNKRIYNLPPAERADNHQQGGVALAPWPSGEGDFPVGGEERTIGYVLGPSADYVIGDRVLAVNPTVPHRHLVFRVGDRENNIWNLQSHAGPVGSKNPEFPETDPYTAFARLFGVASEDPGAAEAVRNRLALRKSMLDLVIAENQALLGRLPAGDKIRVEQYTQSLRDLERTLEPPPKTAACDPQALGVAYLGDRVDPFAAPNHEAVGAAFQKIIALSLACDLTRSISFAWSGCANNRVYSNLGIQESHHDISHKSTDEAFAQIRTIHRHLWTLSTGLYDILKATPEGDGTLWDNTLVVNWNELGQGDVHSIDDSLVVFAGGMGGHFNRGRLLDFDNDVGFCEMLTSCFHYMGFDDVESFGDARLATGGPVPNLTA